MTSMTRRGIHGRTANMAAHPEPSTPPPPGVVVYVLDDMGRWAVFAKIAILASSEVQYRRNFGQRQCHEARDPSTDYERGLRGREKRTNATGGQELWTHTLCLGGAGWG